MSAKLAFEELVFDDSTFPFAIREICTPQSLQLDETINSNITSETIPVLTYTPKNATVLSGKKRLKNPVRTSTFLLLKDETLLANLKYNIPDPISYHIHEFCQISYVVCGKIIYLTNNRVIEVHKDEVLIINSNIPHTWFATENTLIRTAGFYPHMLLSDDYSKQYLNHFNILYNAQFPIIHLRIQNALNFPIITLLNEIYLEHKNKFIGYDTLIHGKMIEISILLFRNQIPNACNQGIKYKPLKEAINFINDHLSANLDLKQVAKKANMNPSYFSHYFKKTLGISFKKYINGQRLVKSISLLKKSDMTISEIMFECGFGSTSTFYQLFSAKYSMSPLKFRKYYGF